MGAGLAREQTCPEMLQRWVVGHALAQLLPEVPLCCAAGAAGGCRHPPLPSSGMLRPFLLNFSYDKTKALEKHPTARSLPVFQVTVGQREEMFLDHESSHPANQVLKYVRNNVLFKTQMREPEEKNTTSPFQNIKVP